MNSVAITFLIFTSLTLIIHFFSDLKKLKVDSRRNWFMTGVVIALVVSNSIFFNYLIVMLSMMLLNFIISIKEKKLNTVIFGAGDKEILQWLVPGFVLISINASILYLVLLMGLFLLFTTYKLITKHKEKTPGLWFITLAFMLNTFIIFL